MTPINEPGNSLPNNQDFKVNRALLRTIVRQRWRAWIAGGLLILGVSLIYGLLLYPQSFPSTVSISMQQTSAPVSPLIAGLTGGGGGNKKYLGILRSRDFAEWVANKTHLRDLYGLPDTPDGNEETVDRLMKSLKVEDNTSDGLLYITVALEGPPRLAPDRGQRQKVKTKAAEAANAYYGKFQDYIRFTDVDKELVLLRGAEKLVHKEEQSYHSAISRLAAFVTNEHSHPVTGKDVKSDSLDVTTAGPQLSSLYARKAQLQSLMKSDEVYVEKTRKALTGGPDQISHIPTEDQLLKQARQDYNDAKAELEKLLITYASGTPGVNRARERLKLAQDRLNQQIQSILTGNTTDERKRQARQVEYDTILQQIDLAERNFRSGKKVGTSLERLRQEVELRLEVLKKVYSSYAELQIQTANAKNRMTIVDRARPPKYGKPGITLVGSLSVFGALFVIGVWAMVEYLMRAQAEGA
jgi:uncharacterized protein involved in exopolysaccharide biosynthesis